MVVLRLLSLLYLNYLTLELCNDILKHILVEV